MWTCFQFSWNLMSTVGNSRSVLENPMDWRAWRATVNGITKNLTGLKWPGMDAHIYVLWFWGAVCWTHQRVPAQAVCLCVLSRFSRLGLLATPWTTALQASPYTDFSRQEYWSGLSFSSPGGLPNPWREPASPALAGGFFTTEPPGKAILPTTTGMREWVDQILKYSFLVNSPLS